MTAQTTAYLPDPITQRDGSSLANSNCRMASIATGIDYQTRGGRTSTGSKMRSYTSDQSGGTDSGDARESWDRGYDEGLTIRDGRTFDDVLADLRAGAFVHLDVWHATVGGPCLSGSGAYGHTMAVAPDCDSSGRWLVADPWCSPPKWSRVAESKLRAGAESWGRQVYGVASREADWPTGGGPIDPRGLLVLAIVARVVRRLMSAADPGKPAPGTFPMPPVDTGGGQPVLYTISTARYAPGGDDMARFVNVNGYAVDSNRRINWGVGAPWYYLDGSQGGKLGGSETVSLRVLGTLDSEADQWVCLITTGIPYNDKVARDTLVLIRSTNDPYPAPEPPTPPDGGGEDVDAAVAERDAEWREWLLAGSPGDEGA